MKTEKYHLYTFSLDGWMRQFNTKFICEFDNYSDALKKAVDIGCNQNHIGYEFQIYKTTYLESKNEK